MNKTFNSLQELETFVQSMDDDSQDQTKYIFDISQISEDQYQLQWQEQKFYTAHDGKTFPDEVWFTKENEMIQIQDLSEAHAKNILRMMIRQRRAAQEFLKATLPEMFSESADDGEDNLDNSNKDSTITLH
jgi:hypothetical protein